MSKVAKSTKPSKQSIQRRFKVVNVRSTRANPVPDEDRGWWVLRDGEPEFGPYERKVDAEECKEGQVQFELEVAKNGPSQPPQDFDDDLDENMPEFGSPLDDEEEDAFEETMPDGGEVPEIPVTKEEVRAEKPPKPKRGCRRPAAGESAKSPKNDAAKPKKSGGKRVKVFGEYSVGTFVRWLGAEKEFDFEEACQLLDALNCRTLKDASIKWELNERRPDKSPAQVTAAHEKQLRREHKALFKGKP